MNEMTVFHFEESFPVRIVIRDGAPWFVAVDVCKALEISNSRDALKNLDNDERSSVAFSDAGENGHSIPRKLNLISESGLYALIMRSNKPNARKFRKWVTTEVLPAIIRDGVYAVPAALAVQSPVPRKTVLIESVVEMLKTLNFRITSGEDIAPHILKYAWNVARISTDVLVKNYLNSRAFRRALTGMDPFSQLCCKLKRHLAAVGGTAYRRDVMRNLHLSCAELDRIEAALTEDGELAVHQDHGVIYTLIGGVDV